MIKELICIGCPRGCHLKVDVDNDYAVTGNSCNIGAEYGRNELKNPTRILTSTVRIDGAAVSCLPVKTNKPIPKGLLFEAMEVVKKTEVKAPVKTGDVIIHNILDTGADLIATKSL